MKDPRPRRIVIGITGASGAVYGVRALAVMRDEGIETHLVVSRGAKEIIAAETEYTVAELASLADFAYEDEDLNAPIASGSFLTDGMIIAPCTMKTLSGVAHSYASNLIERAADVTLKEKRRLVLVVRESPLHKGHLRLMALAADLGAHILPPVPAFYQKPTTIQDVVDQTVGRILDFFGIDNDLQRRWGEVGGSGPDRA